MNAYATFSFVACLLGFAATSLSQTPDHRHLTALDEQREKPITDLKTELAGTTWKADPVNHRHPGLSAELTFDAETLAPEGYRYSVDAADSMTIHFNHGVTQVLQLAPDGFHLTFTFKESEYAYVLIKEHERAGKNLRTELAGTVWRAVPSSHPRPGLSAHLTFREDTVAPEGYRYDVNSGDSITIHFNHGDTQLMLLTSDRKRFKFIFSKKSYEYQLTSK